MQLLSVPVPPSPIDGLDPGSKGPPNKIGCADFVEVMRKLCSLLSGILICDTHNDSNDAPTDHESAGSQVATRAEKSSYRYSDFYCFMTLADFTAYISVDDGEGDGGISISHRYETAA
jgi:hypothetical protein